MKRLYTLLLSCLFIQLSAQVEQISYGAGYSMQAYYNLSTGDITTVSDDTWDVAFSSIGSRDAGIFINESVARGGAPLALYATEITDWSTEITSSMYSTDDQLFNPELSWTEGAFNTTRDTASLGDYGWGKYNPQTHTLDGTTIYVIKKRDDSLIKFQVVGLSRGVYSFKYADLDGSNEKEVSISKSDEADMIYFSFENGEIDTIPSDIDLIFQRYNTPLEAGGQIFNYTVAGILLAPGVESVVLDGVDPDTVDITNHLDKFSAYPKAIGHKWKDINAQFQFFIVDDRAHFVKTRSGEIYKLEFYDFEGSSTGITTLNKTLVQTTSTDQEKELNTIQVLPNLTSNHISIIGLKEKATYTITNTLGHFIKQSSANKSTLIDISTLQNGQYFITINNRTHPFIVLK